mgnify:CR=1 FL=1
MNREILFRAKKVDGSEWIEGYYRYIPCINRHSILPTNPKNEQEEYRVISETVGQYTGLTDKNGKKIFEGDILRHADETILKTVWNDRKYGFAAQCVKGSVLLKDCKWGLWEFESDEVEVIGNMFDNPELLKGEENGCN